VVHDLQLNLVRCPLLFVVFCMHVGFVRIHLQFVYRSWRMGTVAVGTLSEGGAVGDWSREQVRWR
jgi:hypothetical protein